MTLFSSIFTKRENGQEQRIKIHVDPFTKDSFVRATFFIRKDFMTAHGLTFRADVDFKRGSTEGCQKFEEKNFVDLVQKVEAFINSLEK
jgi:hypothetical protein